MYLGTRAQETPDKAAVIHARTGAVLTYRELDDHSNQVAQLLHAQGLRRGDRIAIFMENHLRYMEVVWAAFRSGLYVATLNRYMTADDVAYVVRDCSAKALFTSAAMSEVVTQLSNRLDGCPIRLMMDGSIPGWERYDEAIARHPARALDEEWMGLTLDYTSGTTGRPKGVLRPLPNLKAHETWPAWEQTGKIYGYHRDMVCLAPAPLYHGAPMRSMRPTHMAGGTAVLMDKFDPLEALALIQKYRVTHAHWVPTMLVRLLRLPEEDRKRFDLSSMTFAVHAAAPCPIDVKRRIIDWWGCILNEFYGSTDGVGGTFITCQEWLTHVGSVGKAPPTLHICGEAGNEVPRGEAGLIYFQGARPLPVYLNDPEKTAASRHPEHDDWVCVGDIGYVSDAGYLYITDRKSFTIVSGGVNIYPQMIEDALRAHPAVSDVAVFGVPNDDMGEEVKAVVEPAEGCEPSSELAAELIKFAGTRLARYMVPRSIDFSAQLPRSEVGKLLKKQLRDEYWAGRKLVQ